MGKAGGIIGLIGGLFGVIAALVTLVTGGMAGAVGAEGSGTVVGLGWGGLAFSFAAIVAGALAMSRPRGAGIALMRNGRAL